MGKSYALRSLLVMKHSRAPEQGYYFSGHTASRSGDEYYEGLLDNCIGQGLDPALSSHREMFKPSNVAQLIIMSLKLPVGGPQSRSGIRDIP